MSGTLDIYRNRVRIDIACNDPDGIFAYRAEQIEMGYEFLKLEARLTPAPRFVELPGAFRLAGKKWPTCGSKEWVGNWCWNSYWMDIPTAVNFLVWLQGRNLFHCTCGEERVYNIWNASIRMDKSGREFLNRMLGAFQCHW